MTEEEMIDLLPNLHWAMLCYEYGKLENYIAQGNKELHEDYYSSFYDVLSIASDFIAMDYLEDYCENKYYFGFTSMSEYYRLCRDYCNAHHVSLKQNPYMEQAYRFVNAAMDLDCSGGYAYTLQTKINHEWASGLVVVTDESFFRDEFHLAEALLRINDWYTQALERLKADLTAPVKEVACV